MVKWLALIDISIWLVLASNMETGMACIAAVERLQLCLERSLEWRVTGKKIEISMPGACQRSFYSRRGEIEVT